MDEKERWYKKRQVRQYREQPKKSKEKAQRGYIHRYKEEVCTRRTDRGQRRPGRRRGTLTNKGNRQTQSEEKGL